MAFLSLDFATTRNAVLITFIPCISCVPWSRHLVTTEHTKYTENTL